MIIKRWPFRVQCFLHRQVTKSGWSINIEGTFNNLNLYRAFFDDDCYSPLDLTCGD